VKNIQLFPICLVKVVKNLKAINNIPICFPKAHYVTIIQKFESSSLGWGAALEEVKSQVQLQFFQKEIIHVITSQPCLVV
jgi:hypothetical protein